MILRKLLAATFILLSLNCFSQWNEKSHIDTIAHCVCQELNVNSDKLDSNRLQYAMIRCSSYFNQDDAKSPAFSRQLVTRLLRNCVVFDNYTHATIPNSKNWTISKTQPASKASIEDCRSFARLKKFTYTDPTSSKTVKLTIDNDMWVDHFKDGTYSKLSLQWLDGYNFRITFIQSNNASRNMISIPGDSYDYQILEKSDHYYLLSTHYTGVEKYFTFKLFY